MSHRTAIILWAAGAWVTPALMAGALGWSGIWGSGSAFGDYLIPVPVAGGALHVPSFAVALALAAAWPKLGEGAAALIRGGLLKTSGSSTSGSSRSGSSVSMPGSGSRGSSVIVAAPGSQTQR